MKPSEIGNEKEELVPIQFLVPRALRRDAKVLLAQEEKTWADLLVPHLEDYVESELDC